VKGCLICVLSVGGLQIRLETKTSGQECEVESIDANCKTKIALL
jgi:hypothetical protein